jgi:hypothetical protein
MLQILDVAIGLSFVYLLFSLIVTALNEFVLTLFDQRSAFLKRGLTELLGNHQPTLDNFLRHGLIDSFSREKNGSPSYIPPDAFVAALLDQISPAKIDPANLAKVRDIADIAIALSGAALAENPKLKESVNALLCEAGNDLTRFKLNLEKWYNQSMTRVSGWYKQRVQKVLFCLALVIAVGGNVDSLHLIQGLSMNPKLRDDLVEQASAFTKKHTTDAEGIPSTDIAVVAKEVKDALYELNDVALPIGWGDAQYNYLFADVGHGKAKSLAAGTQGWNWARILTAIIGWIITALAASLGAPFWFDTLNRFVNIRGNGRSPAEAQKAAAITARESAPAPPTIVAVT